MKLPDTTPIDDPAGLWALQLHLLTCAEALFGRRGPSIILCQPRFHDDERPETQFSLDNSGAFAVLGCDAQSDWSYVVHQLAHETVHLLDPVCRGKSNYLEEGVAVSFSLLISRQYGFNFLAPSSGKYGDALKFANELPEGAILSARRIRLTLGKFSGVSADDLVGLFPELNVNVANNLSNKFNR